MTPAEKLALAQRSYATFGRLDSEALIPLYHPECEWRMGSMGAAFGTEAFRGHNGLREFVTGISEGTDSFEAVIDGARITSEGILQLFGHNNARSSVNHIEVSRSFWQEIEFRDGLILTVVPFDEPPPGWDEATPLDLGLTPDTGT
jgi:hypothetical protein